MSATPIPSRNDYTQLRRQEPEYGGRNLTRWQTQLNDYCSDVANLASKIAKGLYVDQNQMARINQDLNKIEEHACCDQSKQTIQKARKHLEGAHTEHFDQVMGNKCPSQERPWQPIPNLTKSLWNAVTGGLFLVCSITKDLLQPQRVIPNRPITEIPCSGVIVSAEIWNQNIGDDLFRIGTAISHAKDIQAEPVFQSHGKNKALFSRLNTFQGPPPPLAIHHEPPFPKDSSIRIDGSFQNVQLFGKSRDQIIKLLSPTPEIEALLKEKYEHLLTPNSVVIHVHRSHISPHPGGLMFDLAKEGNYYEAALRHFDPDQHNFVIVTDDENFVREMPAFERLKQKTVLLENQSTETFHLMSLFKNKIIANTPTSWWTAYIGKQPGEKVIMPATWWGPAQRGWNDHNAEYPYGHYGLLVDGWIKEGVYQPKQEDSPSNLPSALVNLPCNTCGMFSVFHYLLGVTRKFDEGNYSGIEVNFGQSGAYFDSNQGDNWLNYYFEPIHLGVRNKNVATFNMDEYALFAFYAEGKYTHSRKEANAQFQKYFKLKKPIQETIDRFAEEHFKGKPVIAVHYRGTDKGSEAAILNYETMISEVRKGIIDANLENYIIFLATDEAAFVERMEQEFQGQVVTTNAKRSTDGRALHANDPAPYERGLEALTDSMLLGHKNVRKLIRTSSNLSLFSTYINPEMDVVEVSSRLNPVA